MAKRTIRFYFDYISSNAYLAWTQLPALAKRVDAEIEAIPVLFAGLLEAHGQLGPAEVPQKAFWMAKNNLRKALRLGVPLNSPAHHPFNPLLALRVSSLPLAEPERVKLIDVLMDAVWVRSLHVSDPAVVARVASEIGLDGEAIVAAAQQPEVKARLRQQTDAAIARGVFGVPSMDSVDSGDPKVAGGEVFWGFDDFPFFEDTLTGVDPLANANWAEWPKAAPTPSAMRRQFRDRL